MNPRLYQPVVAVEPAKIKPEGLLCVVKVQDKFIGSSDVIFAGVILIFKNKTMLESFRSKVYGREMSGKSDVPILSFASRTKISGIQNQNRFLSVGFKMNSESYFAAQQDCNKTGELLLQDLEKHVDLTGASMIVLNSESGKVENQVDGVEDDLGLMSGFKMI
jgi:hypothetical protein